MGPLYTAFNVFSAYLSKTLLDRPDTVFGKNLIHLLKVRRAVHHHLLLLLDVDGNTGQHSLNKSCPVKSL